jgi:hypothetical protein
MKILWKTIVDIIFNLQTPTIMQLSKKGLCTYHKHQQHGHHCMVGMLGKILCSNMLCPKMFVEINSRFQNFPPFSIFPTSFFHFFSLFYTTLIPLYFSPFFFPFLVTILSRISKISEFMGWQTRGCSPPSMFLYHESDRPFCNT